VLSIPAARRLRVPGYLAMATMIIQQLVELYLRVSPARVHSPAWRLTLIGNFSSAAGGAILGLFVIFAIAVAAEDQGVSYLVSSVSGAAVAACIGAMGMFGLDALQMKNQVQSSLSSSYDVASVWVVAKLVMSAIVFAVLAVSAFRAAKTTRRVAAAPQGTKGPAVLVSTVRPAITPASVRRGADAENG
jgi:hypothetical protein